MTTHHGLVLLCSAIAAAACKRAVQSSATAPAGAIVVVRNAAGASLGTLRFERAADGTRMVGVLTGLPPGPHGIHFHEVGRCDAPGFTSAGGHFNPTAAHHGLENPAGPHAGDLPIIIVPASGRVTVELTSPRVTLDAASTSGLFDADGTALVIHAAADDQRTDPSGNSGARIACGVVTKS
jgi:superoxide dismutase, Cu-Zn family